MQHRKVLILKLIYLFSFFRDIEFVFNFELSQGVIAFSKHFVHYVINLWFPSKCHSAKGPYTW